MFLALFVLAVLGIVAYLVTPLVMTSFEQDRIAQKGVPARARLVSIRETNTRVNHRWVYDLELEIYPDEGKPYRAHVSQPLSNLHVANLRPGMGALVKVDPDNPKSVVVTSTGGPLPADAPGAMTSTAGPPSNPDCKKAAACCRKVSEQEATHCGGFLHPSMPVESCRAALSGFSQAARARQMSCD